MKKKIIQKLILLGDPVVGKTSLKERMSDGKFDPSSQMTIGADVTRVALNLDGDYDLIFQIWDIAGQSKFTDVLDTYFQGARAVLLVYDVTRDATFMNLQGWVEKMVSHIGRDIPLILVGNKMDLEHQRQVSEDRALVYASSLSNWSDQKVKFVQTSAKSGSNVEELFLNLGKQIIQNRITGKVV